MVKNGEKQITKEMEHRPFFIGEYTSSITDGKRVAVPKVYRDQFKSNSVIITRGYEGCLVITEKSEFNELLEGVSDVPFISADKRETARFLLSNAFEVSLDAQGRFIVPDTLEVYAKLLGKDVVFLGVGKWVEIWSPIEWRKYQTGLTKNSKEIANKLLAMKREA